MKTFSPTPEHIDHQWFVVDADNQVLGRLAAQIAHRLRGKHKPEFAPHMDNGDVIVVVNCEKIKVTGAKLEKKKYYHHSGYVGGLREITLDKLLAEKPADVLMHAVRGMLPKNRLAPRIRILPRARSLCPSRTNEARSQSCLSLITARAVARTLLLVPVSMPATALSKSTVVKWKITSPARPFR